MALKVNKYRVIKTTLTRTNCLPLKNTSVSVLLSGRALATERLDVNK